MQFRAFGLARGEGLFDLGAELLRFLTGGEPGLVEQGLCGAGCGGVCLPAFLRHQQAAQGNAGGQGRPGDDNV